MSVYMWLCPNCIQALLMPLQKVHEVPPSQVPTSVAAVRFNSTSLLNAWHQQTASGTQLNPYRDTLMQAHGATLAAPRWGIAACNAARNIIGAMRIASETTQAPSHPHNITAVSCSCGPNVTLWNSWLLRMM